MGSGLRLGWGEGESDAGDGGLPAEERVRGVDVLGCEGEWELSDHVPLFLEVGVGLVQMKTCWGRR